jgi:hypothetical protein
MRSNLRNGLSVSSLILAVFLFASGVVRAQVAETAAQVNGQVTDSAGATLAGANVVITEDATKLERRVQTNDDGLYVITQLNPGTYTLTVEVTGFKRYIETNFVLNTKDRRLVNIVMEPGSVSEVVTVTSESSVIQDSPTGQTLISNKQVVEIPLVNRDFTKLLELVPGITSSLDDETALGLTNRFDVSVNGMRRNGVNVFVDGVSNTDVGSNITLLSTPTIDSIKEFKVLTSNYTAEVGRSGGGTVTVVTRGGANDFHGTVYDFVRHNRFNANTFANNRQGSNPDGTPRAPVPKLRYHNFGGTFSGPVILPRFGEGGDVYWSGRDRTFFFFSEEVRRINRAITNTGSTVPTAAERAGNFSASLGNLLCRNAASNSFAAASAAGVCPAAQPIVATATDTNGQVIQVRTGQIFRPSDGLAFAGNIVPSTLFDPRAVGMMNAFPLPNTGTRGFTFSPANFRNTRQEVIRIDHSINDNWRLLGRYSHDLNETEESGGLFAGFALPDVSTTVTRTPGQTFVASLTGVLSPTVVNEATYNFSSNFIGSLVTGRGRRADYPGASAIGEAFPENNENIIPRIDISGLSSIGAIQGFQIAYKNHVVRDVLTWTRGKHLFKFGGEISFESKNENANANTQGTFGFTGNQSRGAFAATTLVGNATADFLLGRGNTYSEAKIDPTVHFRFGRREFFAQDTMKVRPNLTLDFGVRYQYFQPVRDTNNLLATFDPLAYNPALAPVCANATCSTFLRDPVRELNGIIIAGVNSPYGEYIAKPDKNNFSPRVGLAWDPFSTGKTVIRAGYGFYYDQPLVGGFENSAFFTPPFNVVETFTSSSAGIVTLANPTAGALPTTFGARALVQNTDPNFTTPEIQQWSLGIQHQLFRNAVIDLSYVGTKGDHLIRPLNINIPQPDDVVAVGAGSINLARPFRGFGNISGSGWLETSGISRYHGALSSFAYRFASGASVTLAYTFSKNMTNATNDRDAVDIPQNPQAKDAEYAEARTSRPHVFSASYVYELPFFKKSKSSLVRNLLAGWQISGITNIESGRPIPRVVMNATNQASSQRGSYPNLVSDPNSGLAGTVDPLNGLPYIFDPNAFAIPPLGSFGNAPRAFARERGRNQTNLSAVKNIYFDKEKTFYLQLRAESFNVFNHTQFLGINVTQGNVGFGQVTGSTRLPREFQFAAKLYF